MELKNSYYVIENDKVLNIPSNEEFLKTLRRKLDDYAKEVEYYKKKYNESLEETFTNTKIQECKEQLEEAKQMLSYGFGIDKETHEKIMNWHKSHSKNTGAMRKNSALHSLTYEFIPTELGVVGTVKCSCGKTYKFSDLG